MEEKNENLPSVPASNNSNASDRTSDVFVPDEIAILKRNRDLKQAIIEKMSDRLINSNNICAEDLQALTALFNSQESQVINIAKLRQRSKESENADENIKALIIATLAQSRKKKEELVPIPGGRETRHVDVELIEGQTSTEVKQFTLKEIQEEVDKKKNVKPESIVKE